MIAIPKSDTAIEIRHVGSFVAVTVTSGRDVIWTRTVDHRNTEKMRRWLLESDLPLSVQHTIDGHLCDIEDAVVDESLHAKWNRQEIVCWLVMVACAVASIACAVVLWNY